MELKKMCGQTNIVMENGDVVGEVVRVAASCGCGFDVSQLKINPDYRGTLGTDELRQIADLLDKHDQNF